MRLATWFCLALGFAAAPALAAPAVEAHFFDDMGRRAFASGAYAQALDEFLLAHAVAPSPRSLYNIALCAELAGNSEVAFVHYREYLGAADPDQARHAEASRRLEMLKGKLALIAVVSDPPGATIYADRLELGSQGTTPAVIVVAPGAHDLILERDGFITGTTKASAQRGQVEQVTLSLVPRLGEVHVQISPRQAKLEVLKDGLLVQAVLDGEGLLRLQIGSYVMRVSALGHAARETQVNVHEGQRAHVALAATPLPKMTSRLLIASPNVAADVYVDGVHVAVTPATLPNISVGSHEVEVRARGRRWRRRVVLRPERALYLEAHFSQFERAGAQRGASAGR